jgi:hypothetical protein
VLTPSPAPFECDHGIHQRPFSHAEEAWFWFIHCQRVRREGARLSSGGATFGRPCDPDDIYCTVMRLRERMLITTAHLRVLATFGLRGYPPDTRCPEERPAARLWNETMDRLSTPLREKGIIA